MRLRALLPLLLLPLAAPLAALEIGSLELLGEVRIDPGSELDGTLVGGLSGITYDPQLDRYYVITDDPSLRSTSRFYTFSIDLSGGTLSEDKVVLEGVTPLVDRRGRPFGPRVIDGEGIALTPERTLLISSEGNVRRGIPPSIREIGLDGRELRELKLPKQWKPKTETQPRGARHNQAIEALTVVPEGATFFAATENAVHQDGPETDVGRGSRTRIVRFDLSSGKPGAHYVYEIEPVVHAPLVADAFRTNGLVDLLAIDEKRLIALERSFTVGMGNSIRLFLISTEGADDVSRLPSLDDRADVRPVAKRLLLDLGELGLVLDNVEGLTIGPQLPDGRSSLVLISDDNFSDAQFTQLLALAVGTERVTVPAVQGAGHHSPLAGRFVFGVGGVVTAADLEGRRKGFWMQDPQGDGDPSSSDGVFVALGELAEELDPPPAAGDLVSVMGRVAEAGRDGAPPVTRIDAIEVEVVRSEVELPEPVRVGPGGQSVPAIVDDDGLASYEPQEDAIDFWESLEGMRVEVADPRAVGPLTRFGTFTVVAGGEAPQNATASGGVLLGEDESNPERLIVDTSLAGFEGDLHVGHSVEPPLVGVIDYAFGNYRLVASDEIRVGGRAAERGRTSLPERPGALTIATYNVENLDAGDNPEKFSRVAKSIVTGLGAPDLVALQEIQDDTGRLDDGTVSATLTLGKLIEAIAEAGGPDYAFTQLDPENNADGGAPGANIRVVFLYNPERLTLAETPGPLLPTNPARLASESPAFREDEQSGFEATRKPLAAEFEFGEHRLLAINVHLKSKRGDDPLFGARQPPQRATEVQRLEQTSDLGAKLEAVLDSDPEALVVLLGDFNEHEFRGPMRALEEFGLVSLVPRVPADRRYTYNYEGNSQMLDHILVSPALAALDPEVEIVHLNADFSSRSRASDHDPMLASFVMAIE
jgi:predicted extracellular nuclease